MLDNILADCSLKSSSKNFLGLPRGIGRDSRKVWNLNALDWLNAFSAHKKHTVLNRYSFPSRICCQEFTNSKLLASVLTLPAIAVILKPYNLHYRTVVTKCYLCLPVWVSLQRPLFLGQLIAAATLYLHDPQHKR